MRRISRTLGGHVLVDFEADYIGETALPDAFFDGLEEVAGFELLNGGVGVAGYVEGMSFEDFHAGEECLQVVNDQVLEPDEVQWLGGLCWRIFFCVSLCISLCISPGVFFPVFLCVLYQVGQVHQLRQAVGDFYAGEVFDTLGVANQDGQIEAEIGNVREGAAGIEG